MLILGLVIFYCFINKGTLTVSPLTPGSKIFINNAVYDSFPAKIILKPGKYQMLVTKDGYLPSKNSYTILAFQTLSLRPELKEIYLVNYFDANNFMAPKVSSDNSEIYFYNYSQKMIQKMPIFYTQSEIEQNGRESVSSALNIEGTIDDLRVIWSPSATKVAILDSTGVTIYDRLVNRSYRGNDVQGLTFVGEDDVIYNDVNGIYRSSSNLTGQTKIQATITGTKTLAVAEDKTLLAIGGNTLVIYDLIKQKNLLELNKKISQIKWSGDGWLAFTEDNGNDSQLSILDLNNGKPKSLGMVEKNRFIWQKNYLIYLTKEGSDKQIAKYDKSNNIKTFLYRPAAGDETQFIQGQDDKLIFSTLSDKPMLIAIKLD